MQSPTAALPATTTAKAWWERFVVDGLRNFSAVRPARRGKPSIPAEKLEQVVAVDVV